MGLYNIELGFWDGLLVTAAIILIIWGLVYAATVTGAVFWFAIIAFGALFAYILGKRGIGRLIKGSGRR